MIKELRRRMTALMMTAFTLIIIALVAFIVAVPEIQKKGEIRRSLEAISGNSVNHEKTQDFQRKEVSGKPDDSLDPPPEKPGFDTEIPQIPQDLNLSSRLLREYGGNVLSVEVDEDGSISSWTSEIDGYYTEESVRSILDRVISSDDEFGYRSGYYFLEHTTPTGSSYTILDSSSSINDFRRTLLWGITGGVAAWVMLFFLSLKLTRMMVKPVEETLERQNAFISDASHELKTPVAVIQANAEVLRSECGDSRWLGYIITETHRMDKLVKDLLFLTVVDNAREEFGTIDLSRLVEGTVLPFEALAFEKGIVIESSVDEGIHIKGNEDEIEKLISILLSNAVKYSYDNTRIKISLTAWYRTAVLRVRNEGEGVRECDKEKIFERFYRTDKARSRESGSYGLGLAMARTIARNHKAKLRVESEYGKWIEFYFEIREV